MQRTQKRMIGYTETTPGSDIFDRSVNFKSPAHLSNSEMSSIFIKDAVGC
jgi:hypothetical protein